MAEYGFVFNATRCTGCKTCVLACKDTKNLPCDVSFRQVYEYEGSASTVSGTVGAGSSPISAQAWTCDENGAWHVDAYVYYVSLACNHCADPVCMHVCPTGAMHRNGLGFVVVDEYRCVGCGYCALSCPYHAPHLDRELGRSVKCDGCTDRVARGLMPVCVAACPQRALDFGALGELRERYGTGGWCAPLPDPGYTVPSLIVVPPHNARPCDDATGIVANRTELA